ncbi:hypothetical protein [uncultured Desulfovibrio sp.]|uniref:hypothetical protein n=1 Tax=uncultured Desulfovibrio sp. TaxID=167968 RepID=UPI002805B55E|nr:hypothetical protein [uncultured Desulfovibrio sp.]
MSHFCLRSFLVLLAAAFLCGCNAYQPTKNVWKTTKGLWNTYVSPPASVDYEEKGDLPPQALTLSTSMIGIDVELGKLERVMQNADKPPTREWLNNLFASFPWLSGFAGVKYDGTILGQEPANALKELDFIPLLYEDKKQNSRALRADVQPSPLGPEVMLATPLYDGVDFLGIVVAYFDIRALMHYSEHPQDMVVLSPSALLWPGKYEFAATPLAGLDWGEIVKHSSAGTCTNATGSFFYLVRYLGNLPLIFAVPEKGQFPEGNGDVQQGAQFFPQEREKLPPPPMPERANKVDGAVPSFGTAGVEAPLSGASLEGASPAPSPADAVSGTNGAGQPARSANEIDPGSRDSVLLKGKAKERQRVQERQLEGENVPVERVQRPRRPVAPKKPRQQAPALDLIPDADMPALPGGRPSPFGPREEQAAPARPSPFGPKESAAPEEAAQTAPATRETPQAPAGEETRPQEAAPEPAPEAATPAEEAPAREPATLPGGRPSPFGPRN